MNPVHTTPNRTLRCLAGLAALAVALPAAAHPGHGGTGFLAGFAHPFTGLDHLLALVAVGMASRQQARGWALPPLFIALAALGALCAGIAIPDAALELSIAATVVLLGALAASGWRLAPAVALPLVGACAFVHGVAHGRELAGMASGVGFVLASAVLMGVGALPGERVRRVAGVAIGLAGAWLLVG